MRTSEPVFEKYKKVCDNLPNIVVLTKSATPGKVQLTFAHVPVGKKFLWESVAAFALEVLIDSPSVILIDINIAFVMDG